MPLEKPLLAHAGSREPLTQRPLTPLIGQSLAKFADSDPLEVVGAFGVTWDSLPEPTPGRPDCPVPILATRLIPIPARTQKLALGE